MPPGLPAITLPRTDRDVSDPTLVRDEFTTLLASVVPVSVPAGATTAAVDAAVTRPFALTVSTGIAVDEPKLPTLLLTVARVNGSAVVPLPVASPEAVIVWFAVRYAVFEAAVTRPFALTVSVLNVPTFALTVANVPAAVTLALPLNDGLVHVKSPVIASVRPVARVVAVEALPVSAPVNVVALIVVPVSAPESVPPVRGKSKEA